MRYRLSGPLAAMAIELDLIIDYSISGGRRYGLLSSAELDIHRLFISIQFNFQFVADDAVEPDT